MTNRVTFDKAKKLRDIGYPQTSDKFYIQKFDEELEPDLVESSFLDTPSVYQVLHVEWCAAPTIEDAAKWLSE